MVFNSIFAKNYSNITLIKEFMVNMSYLLLLIIVICDKI